MCIPYQVRCAPCTRLTVLTVDGPTLDRVRLVADVTLLPIADLTAVLHDRDAVLSSEEITALSDHVRRRYSTP